MKKNLIFIFLGAVFGIVLTKAEVISWYRITDMFRFKEAHMYLLIGSAVVVGMISVQLLKRLNIRSLSGEQLKISEKPYTKGFIYGGMMFGFGWAITGACPGPIFAQIGAGELPALFTLLGAVLGTYLYALVKSKLPH